MLEILSDMFPELPVGVAFEELQKKWPQLNYQTKVIKVQSRSHTLLYFDESVTPTFAWRTIPVTGIRGFLWRLHHAVFPNTNNKGLRPTREEINSPAYSEITITIETLKIIHGNFPDDLKSYYASMGYEPMTDTLVIKEQ